MTDLNIVKATRAAMIWRSAARPDRARIYLRYLRWLYRYPMKLVKAVAANGKETRRRYGRSVPGQVRDMLKVGFVNGLLPQDYYLAALARHGGGSEILRYPPFALLRMTVPRLVLGGDPEKIGNLKNKTAFERRCCAAGLPVVRTIAIVRETGVRSPQGAVLEGPLPDSDLFIKPEFGEQGHRTEGWRSLGAGQFSNADGRVLSSAELLKRAASIAGEHGGAVLVQERLRNHPDLRPISGSALSTTRIVTMLDEAGQPEIVDAFYRTSFKPHAEVDNFHNGGVLFPIDITTGTLHPGMLDAAFDQQSITSHPETGTPMVGRKHPHWREASELALRLHAIYAECIMSGWDIAVSPDGPVALEMNVPPGISINRQPTLGGLVGTRILSLLAFHARQWLERSEPPASRRRVGIDLQCAPDGERAPLIRQPERPAAHPVRPPARPKRTDAATAPD